MRDQFVLERFSPTTSQSGPSQKRFGTTSLFIAIVLAFAPVGSTAQIAEVGGSKLQVVPVPISFIHVDSTGVHGSAFANGIRSALGELDGVTTTPQADLVLWLRTIEFPLDGTMAIGYSVIVDYNGYHITDNLGVTTPAEGTVATQSVVTMVAELAREVRRSGHLASGN